MSLDAELRAMLRQTFSIEEPIEGAEDARGNIPITYAAAGTLLGLIEPYAGAIGAEQITDGRDEGSSRFLLFAVPEASFSRRSRLLGPDAEGRIFSVLTVSPLYDEETLHHFEAILLEQT